MPENPNHKNCSYFIKKLNCVMFVFVWQRPRKTTSSWFYQFFKDNELWKNWDKYSDIICTQQIKSTLERFIFHPRWISRLNRAARTQRTTGSMCQTKTENLEHSTNNRSINISRLKTKCWIHKISSSVKEIKTILTNIVKIPESKISLHPLCFCCRLLLINIITPLYYNYLTISCCQSNI